MANSIEYEVEVKGTDRLYGPYSNRKAAKDTALSTGYSCIIWRRSRVALEEVPPCTVKKEQ
jgi:hypothetical protein